MKENIEVDSDVPDPDKCGIKLPKGVEKEIESFKKEVIMIGRLKRIILKRKLKKEKVALLSQMVELNRKLKILNDLDGMEKEKKK